MSTVRVVPAAFTASTTSAAIDLGEGTLVGLILPATHVGTTLKFQGSDDINGTYTDIYYIPVLAAVLLQFTGLTTLTALNVTLSPELLAGFKFLKLVSGSAETLSITCMVRNMGAR